ncbi:MAG: hypothetical protein D6710_06505 [Nitrospirae bacterium]|nr:MAG: hypothetical protein D6710_06505 [Nitrospirota bacterium]
MELNTHMMKELNRLKRDIFYELMNIVGRVFIVVRYHRDVKIGQRGFLPEEKEKGIVLVFNSRMKFSFDHWGIEAKLVFGTRVEHCLIPVQHIIGIYSPELNCQFFALPPELEENKEREEKEEKDEEIKQTESSKVVKVDFRKKPSP